jgi:hypothetical protein
MTFKQLYQDIYQKFLEKKDRFQGYDFQESPVGSASPPLNRPNRLQKIRQVRDQRQQDIINIKSPPSANR